MSSGFRAEAATETERVIADAFDMATKNQLEENEEYTQVTRLGVAQGLEARKAGNQ